MPTTPEKPLDLDLGGSNDPLCWLSNPNHPRFKASMLKTCIICHAKPGRPCWNTIDDAAPLPGRLIHIGRIEIT